MALAATTLASVLFTVNVVVVLATGDDAPVWPTHYSAFFWCS